jgi:hypothetical protein
MKSFDGSKKEDERVNSAQALDILNIETDEKRVDFSDTSKTSLVLCIIFFLS